MLEDFLIKKVDQFNKQNIKLNILGNKNFSKKLNLLLKKAEKLTAKNKKLQINLALNYGSKVEIIEAFKKLTKSKKNLMN